MKGDFTRSTFEPAKHYSSVRMQQGRVQLDADWNEQLDITAHRIATETVDVIGPTGAPQDGGGFEIGLTPDGSDLAISPGRIYVDGILCELDPSAVPIKINGNEVTLEALTLDGRVLAEDEWVEILYPDGTAASCKIVAVNVASRVLTLDGGAATSPPEARLRRLTTLTTQYDLPGETMPGAGSHAVILDVWERHVTAHEDSDIREIALGGPDTATRTQVIAQVKLIELNGFKGPLTCGNVPDWRAQLPQRTGRLRARAHPEETQKEPCLTPAGEGYRRLENQLYRVEVHRVRKDGVTFKWSRDNGSIVTDWTGQNGNDLQVSSLGRDNVLGFRSTTWAELIDDTHELCGEAGTLVRVIPSSTVDNTLTINDIKTDVEAPDGGVSSTTDRKQFPRHPKLRRWDSDGEVKIEAPSSNNGYLKLEGGVEIRFDKDGAYQPGDYWLIPARTAIGDEGGDVLWPVDLSDPNNPLASLPHGIQHHYCLLAVWQFDKDPRDCRPEFPSLTKLTTLLYESGDGQEARPGELLPQSLAVRVVNGQAPVIGASVRFTVEAGNGSLSVAKPVPTRTPDGVATCRWTLGNAASGSQRVRAELLDAAGNPILGQVLHFNANLSIANLLYVGGDGQEAMPNNPLLQTLRARVIDEQGPVLGARVQFTVTLGGGSFSGAATVATVTTVSANAIAECAWTLGAAGPQQVQAVLLDSAGQPVPGQFLQFNANLSVASQVAYDPAQCNNLAGATNLQDAIDMLCRLVGRPQEPGIHIDKVEIGGLAFHNDTFFPVTALTDGIRVTCDSAVFPGSASSHPGLYPNPVCFVTLDLPYPVTPQDNEFWKGFHSDGLLGHTPLVLAGDVQAKGRVIEWRPAANTKSWLSSSLFEALKQRYSGLPLLVHLTLKGNYIWGPDDPKFYLDGEVFGAPGAGNTEIKLSSGDNLRGGDFEAWFWLADMRIGVIPRRNIVAATSAPTFTQALNMALNRDQLRQFLPAAYPLAQGQPPDPTKSSNLINGLGLKGAPLKVWAGQSNQRLAEATIDMLINNAGLKPQLTLIDDSVLLINLQTALAAGAVPPDMIIGDGSIADALAGRAPNLFDGSMVRF